MPPGLELNSVQIHAVAAGITPSPLPSRGRRGDRMELRFAARMSLLLALFGQSRHRSNLGAIGLRAADGRLDNLILRLSGYLRLHGDDFWED